MPTTPRSSDSAPGFAAHSTHHPAPAADSSKDRPLAGSAKSRLSRDLIIGIAFALGYLLLSRLCSASAEFRGGLPSVWPPAGLSAALLLIAGRRFWWAVVLGSGLVVASMGMSLPIIAFNCLAQLAEVLLFVGILARIRSFDLSLSRASDVAKLVLWAALPSTLIGGFLGCIGWSLGGEIPADQIVRDSLMWWLRNFAGIVLITPLILVWRRRPLWDRTAWIAVLVPFFFLVACAVAVGRIDAPASLGALLGLLTLTLPLPLILWVGWRHGMHGITGIHLAMFVVITEAGYQLNSVYGRTQVIPYVEVVVFEVIVAMIVLITSLLLTAAITERRALETAARRSQRLDALGRLAGGVAHDFNNMLAVITANLSIARDAMQREPSSPPVPETVREPIDFSLGQIELAVERAEGLTRQLLHFGRKVGGKVEEVDLPDVVVEMRKLLHHLLGPQIDLDLQIDDPIAPIRIVRSQVEQVVMNLILNARDAIGGPGEITVGIEMVDRPLLSDDAAEVDSPHVRLSVRDNGSGIEPRFLEQIFDPFVTSKGEGKGTGLGLATVYGIVKGTGGEISVESTVGVGTTFTVDFPAITRRAPVASVKTSPDGPERRTAPRSAEAVAPAATEADRLPADAEQILVCDDDESVRRAIEGILSHAGYRVITAEHPHLALRIFEGNDAPPDLLLTDIVMPDLDGTQLADRVSALHPNLRILFMSGYRSNPEIGESQWLAKPFSSEALLSRVRALLDAEGTGRVPPSSAPQA